MRAIGGADTTFVDCSTIHFFFTKYTSCHSHFFAPARAALKHY